LSSFADRPWFATQWLLEVVASGAVDRFGLVAVSWMVGVGVLLLGMSLLTSCRAQAHALPASVAAFLAMLGTAPVWSARPQLASVVLTVVVVSVWLRTSQDLRPRWWLIPLSWVWACTHGLWFSGLLVGLAVSVGLCLDRRVRGRKAAALLAVPVLSGLIAAATPVGPKLLTAPLTIAGVAPMVSEWQPPDVHDPNVAVTALMALGVVVIWSRSGNKVPWAHLTMFALACAWAVLSVRTVALAAVILAPLLAGCLQSVVNGPFAPLAKRERAAHLCALLLGGTVLALVAPSLSRGDFVTAELDRAVARIPSGSVIFNDDEMGGWLEWRHRQVTPVVDGLLDAYDPGYLAEYTEIMRLAPGWERGIVNSGATFALLEPESPLADGLEGQLGWDIVVTSQDYVLLQHPGAASGAPTTAPSGSDTPFGALLRISGCGTPGPARWRAAPGTTPHRSRCPAPVRTPGPRAW
jgi:hypothetical protein